MPRRDVPDPVDVARSYDASARNYDARFRADPRTAARFRVVDAPQLEIARGHTRVLEIGCGTGRLLADVDARERVGVDISSELLRAARARGLVTIKADAHALPFADGTFNAVLAGNGVFRYLDYPRAFRECARVLTPGGRLAVHQYARSAVSLRRRRAPEHASIALQVGSLDEVRAPARAAGLIEERVFLWRGIPFYPYALRLPEWAAGRLWNHVTFVFRRA